MFTMCKKIFIKMKKNILFTFLAILALCSCSTAKDNSTLTYFKNLQGNDGTLSAPQSDYLIRVQPDDELIITVSSSVPEATAMYNVPLTNPATRGTTQAQGQARLQTYIIDKQGNIDFPVLGSLHVEGMTTGEIAGMIKGKVQQNVKDPYVRVEMSGFGVNVLGEVRNPHRVGIDTEKFTLIDALAAAGDLTEYAQRDDILVVRTENGKSTYHRMNLTDASIFASPYFYMQQNDIVYVAPNKIKVDNSKYNQYTAFKLSQMSTIVSMASVIASLVIALAIRK